MRKIVLFSAAVFSAFGLVGPLIQQVYRPSVSFLILVWPTLVFTAGGTARTLRHDLAMTAGMNVIFFGCVGLTIAVIAVRHWAVVGSYVAVCALVILGAAWGAGFSFAFFSWKDVIVAMMLYALPFFAVWWTARVGSLKHAS